LERKKKNGKRKMEPADPHLEDDWTPLICGGLPVVATIVNGFAEPTLIPTFQSNDSGAVNCGLRLKDIGSHDGDHDI
jgi:hypothetical protein